MAAKIEFSRGDPAYHTFAIPVSNWSAGGRLFFGAKPAIDDDTTDANAVIKQNWDDTALIADVVINGVTYKKYNCYFPPSTTSGIASGGAGSADYLGEFEYVPTTGLPITVPADDNKFDCVVYFDVVRKTTV